MSPPKEERGDGSLVVNLQEFYKYDPEDIFPDITATAYSNLAYIQVSHRDVYIDFLEMPGVKREDGKMHVTGTRIFMSHAAARRLSDALDGILDKVHREGGMEEYEQVKTGETPLSSKMKRPSEERST
ncbi:MAG: DUF3467 domain-containing protein [Methanomicrobiales archaeon]